MPKYIVVEIQTTVEGAVSTIVNDYDDQKLAEARYHTILSAAPVSVGLAKHSAIMFSEEGFPIRHECYNHIEENTEE